MAAVRGVVVGEVAHPILGFNVYNVDKTTITEFTKTQLQVCANATWFLNGIRTTFSVLVSIAQVDIAILRVLYGNIALVVTVHMLLAEKTFLPITSTDAGASNNDGYEQIPLTDMQPAT